MSIAPSDVTPQNAQNLAMNEILFIFLGVRGGTLMGIFVGRDVSLLIEIGHSYSADLLQGPHARAVPEGPGLPLRHLRRVVPLRVGVGSSFFALGAVKLRLRSSISRRLQQLLVVPRIFPKRPSATRALAFARALRFISLAQLRLPCRPVWWPFRLHLCCLLVHSNCLVFFSRHILFDKRVFLLLANRLRLLPSI